MNTIAMVMKLLMATKRGFDNCVWVVCAASVLSNAGAGYKESQERDIEKIRITVSNMFC